MILKIKKLLKFFPYYLEVFAKKLSSRGIMDTHTNGEFKILEGIVKNSKDYAVCFFDGDKFRKSFIRVNIILQTI